jgi:hypothetical protein
MDSSQERMENQIVEQFVPPVEENKELQTIE